MRPIKFRAWDKDTETMFIPEYISGDGKVYEDIGVSFQQELSERKNVILLQFTGLKDRSGREIYEGDVISDHVGVGTVKYSDDNCAYRVSYGDGRAKWFYDYFLRGEKESIEVIGNIYENPELLEEQK